MRVHAPGGRNLAGPTPSAVRRAQCRRRVRSYADADRTADEIKQQLTAAVRTALAQASGVEGGIWRASEGSIAYAFPTYEGTGPKTDVPAAELATIKQVNADTLRSGYDLA